MNENCKGKLLGKLSRFVDKESINIDGLSDQTIELLINNKYLNTYVDLYHLKDFKEELVKLPGLGHRSVTKLLANIEKSRNTTLTRFLIALGIPNVGKTASKLIENHINFHKLDEETVIEYLMDNVFNVPWNVIDGIGDVIAKSFIDYFDNNMEMIYKLMKEFEFTEPVRKEVTSNALEDKIIVITGDLHIFKNRKELVEKIEACKGKVTGSVSKNTSLVICNEKESTSSKMQKARKLGLPVISEEEFMKMIGE